MRKLFSFIFTHKIGLFILVLIISVLAGSLIFREKFIKTITIDKSGVSYNTYQPLPVTTPLPTSIATDSAASNDNTVLGTSTDNSSYTPPVYSPPKIPDSPSFTPAPTPAPTAAPTQSTNSSPSCDPNADKSQVYVSPSSVAINSTSTISVELRDCNNNLASNGHLTITMTSGDAATTINGSASPYKAQAQDGKYSFTVKSPNPTTAIFKIQDTDHNFEVTMPNYKTPQVTFTSGSSNLGCASGKDAAYYSYVRYPSASVDVGSKVTITIDLRDCNNQATLGGDTVTVTPKSVVAGFQFVGFGTGSFTLPGGQRTFQVTSSSAGTNTFTVMDTTGGFEVTDSKNQTPTITFTNAASTPTPTPSVSSTPSPSASPSPTPTPTPTLSQTPTPSP